MSVKAGGDVKLVNCIIPTFNAARYLRDAIDSVVDQTIGFDAVNLVIVDDGSTDNTSEIVRSFQILYPEITYLYQLNSGVSAARNAGLEYCKEHSLAPYTCFLDADDKYDPKHIEVLTTFLESHADVAAETEQVEEFDVGANTKGPDVAFVPIDQFERVTGLHVAYKSIDRGRTRVIDLRLENVFFSHVQSAMFRSDAIIDNRFDTSLSISEDADFLLKVLTKKNLAGWYNENVYLHLRKRSDGSSAIDNSSANPALYERIARYRAEFERYVSEAGEVPRIVQNSRLYDIRWLAEPKANPVVYGIAFDVDGAMNDIKFIVKHIDVDVLKQHYIPYWLRMLFFQMKFGEFHVRNSATDIVPQYLAGEYPVADMTGNVWVQFIRQRQDVLHIRGFFNKASYDGVRLVARFGDRIVEPRVSTSSRNDRKFVLGKEIFPARDFEFNIRVDELSDGIVSSLVLYFEYERKLCPAYIKNAWTSRFYYSNDYFVGDMVIVKRTPADNALSVERLGFHHLVDVVLRSTARFKDPDLVQKYVEYFEAFRNKRIWLFIDRNNRIDDNAEALFRYCANMRDGIVKFMVVPDESYVSEFDGVSTNIIVYGSFEFKLLLMFAEKYISSTTFYDSNVATSIPKWDFRKIVDALSQFQEIFLQHGIIQNDNVIDSYLNVSKRDLDLFVVSTRSECMSVLRNSGFSTNVVKLTGLPRFDLLESESQKVVTVVFTWRRLLADIEARAYNVSFRNTPYFEMVNGLISDEGLLEALRQAGYRLVLKLHPEVYVQRQDFAERDVVTVVTDEISYRELYRISSLMVTDYSSAVFDFAYLKKPVLYYQDSAVESNYGVDDGLAFNYVSDGFGDIVSTREACVSGILDCLASGCKMDSRYVSRVDSFFAFHDSRNCERVYLELLGMPGRAASWLSLEQN